MDAQQAVTVVAVWEVLAGASLVVVGIGGALWRFWHAVRQTIREEKSGLRTEVAAVKADLKVLADQMSPLRDRVTVVETLLSERVPPRAKRARAKA